MSKINVWKWNRNVLLGALLLSVAVATLVPTSGRTRAIETGASAEANAPGTSHAFVEYAPDVRVPSVARLSRNGAPVPGIVMVDVLHAVGLRSVVIASASTRPQGTVLFTNPGSEVDVARGSLVEVVVSGGSARSPSASGGQD